MINMQTQLSWIDKLTRNDNHLVSYFPHLSLGLLFAGFIFLITACSPSDEPNQQDNTVVASPTPEKKIVPKKVEKKTKKLEPGKTPAYQGKLSSLSKLNIRDAKLEKILTGLNRPWAFEFINNNELIITEITGKLSIYNLETKQLTPISGLPKIAINQVQAGLLDVEIHPDFVNNKRIYFSYIISNEDEKEEHYHLVVATAIIKDNKLQDIEQIVSATPFTKVISNFGGALEFDADGYLYISIGDRGRLVAQKGNQSDGKILRLHDDGSIPKDNPFINNKDFDDRIYAIGFRNTQGLHFDPQTGNLYETEHGPLGGDEVNIVEAGLDYGWPTITYGSYYATAIPMGETHQEGMEQPIFYYLPSEAISPITMYRGTMFPRWEGNLLVGTLRGHHVSKLDLNVDSTIIRSEYPILNEIKDRIRDIKVADDGSIYIITQGGTLYRLYR